jgi:hypothetical protein
LIENGDAFHDRAVDRNHTPHHEAILRSIASTRPPRACRCDI